MNLIKNSILLFSILSFMMFSLQGCASSKQVQQERAQQIVEPFTQATSVSDSLYKIKPGDDIEILVWEQSRFNTKTKVSSLGTIAIPLIGEIYASGLTQQEFKQDLKQRLSRYIKEEINLTVSISNSDSLQVSVLGMVSRPDNYPVVNQTSILKVLSMAGGPSDDADIRKVRIYRNNSSRYTTLDLKKHLDNGQTYSGNTVLIYPGDVVYIPRKENAVREVSLFLGDVLVLFGIFRLVN